VSVGSAINNLGQVAGVSSLVNSGNSLVAFVSGPGGSPLNALFVGGGLLVDGGYPVGLNSSGQTCWTVGTTSSNQSYLLSKDSITGLYQSTPISVTGARNARPFDINDSGQVVGTAAALRAIGGGVGFITGPNGQGSLVIDVLGSYDTVAYGLNSSGDVVGNFYNGLRSLAFLYRGGSPVDLNTITALPEGVRLGVAWDINDSRQILATDDNNGVWLLTPSGAGVGGENSGDVPLPAWALVLLGSGLMASLWKRNPRGSA
jgi:hypothetical protein